MLRTPITFLVLFIGTLLCAQDFEVSPVLMSFNSDPGEIQKKQITLTNHSSKPQKYTLKVSDYLLDKDGNKKVVQSGTNKRSCADWITINPSFIELTPNQTTTLEALMAVPKDGFSARWCMIHVEVSNEQTPFEADKSLATGVLVVPRIVIMVKQSPRSNNNYKATINNLKEITKKTDLERNFEVLVTNIGDNIVEGTITLALANMQTTKEEKFNPVKVTVYPDASRIVKLQLPKTLPKGKYALAAILDYGHRQPLGGTQLMLDIK